MSMLYGLGQLLSEPDSSKALETELHDKAVKDVKRSMQRARNEPKPRVDELFNDVYDQLPLRLQRQRKEMWEVVKKYKEHYPLDIHES